MKNILHFFIGDIHGCFEELLELEQKIERLALKFKSKPIIVSVGDLIDRGPYSQQVIDHFMLGQVEGSHQCVMGNHETLFLQYLANRHGQWFKEHLFILPPYFFSLKERYERSSWSKDMSFEDFQTMVENLWLDQGGAQCLESYGIDLDLPKPQLIPPEHIHFLCSLPIFIEKEKFIATHGLPIKSKFELVKSYMVGERILSNEVKVACDSLYWNRSIKKTEIIKNKILISGHTPFLKTRRHKTKNIMQVDTLCFGGGRLSAYCPEIDQSIWVGAHHRYF